MTIVKILSKPILAGALGATILAAAVGCSSAQSATSESNRVFITVSAAASLTDAFAAIASEFEKADPTVDVTTSFGASSTVVEQVVNGAPVDVLATASESTMADAVTAQVTVGVPQVFAVNELAIAVPPGNPAQIRTISDLSRPGVKVAICQPQVPCGQTATQLFTNAGLSVQPVTREPDVRAVLAKVTGDDVDAGIVYRSDVVAAGAAVEEVPVPTNINVTTRYPIVLIAGRPNEAAAARFVAYLRSAAGKRILIANGFTPASS